MIEQIIYSNLDRRTDRNVWFLTNMEAAGVPMEMVERIPAKDWQDYNSVEATIRAMQKDGFMVNKPVIPDDKRGKAFRGHATYFWTMMIALDRIARGDKVTLMLHDDATVKYWDDLIECLERIESYQTTVSELLQLVALGWRSKPNAKPNVVTPFQDGWIWNYGINMGMAEAVVYTPVGADRMLSLLQGAIDNLIGVEWLLHEHFNNYNSFQTVHPFRFVDNTRRDSDLNPADNPEMLE